MPWSDQIREAVRSDGRTPYALARDADIDAKALRKFLDGKAGLSLDAFEKVATAVGLSLSPARGVLLPAKELPRQPESAQTTETGAEPIEDRPSPARGMGPPHARDGALTAEQSAELAEMHAESRTPGAMAEEDRERGAIRREFPPTPTHKNPPIPRAGDGRPLAPNQIRLRRMFGMPT